MCFWAGCKDKGTAKEKPAGIEQRCELLAKACGDEAKHVEKIGNECKAAAKKHVEKGCADKATAVYDCYEKEVCGKDDKVWAVDDLRVLAERQNKCGAERTALKECLAGK